MRVAVCFYGINRSLSLTFPSIQSCIYEPLQQLGIEFDVFTALMHPKQGFSNPRSHEKDCSTEIESVNLLRSKSMVFLDQEDFDRKVDYASYALTPERDQYNDGHASSRNIFRAMFSLKCAYGLSEKSGAYDYLTKPVRLERLQQALQKVERLLRNHSGSTPPEPQEALLIQERGRTERVPLAEVLYFKAELKYVTVRTASRSYILDGSLAELEERYAGLFLRIHRNALVAVRALRALEKHDDPQEGEGWAVRLDGVDERLSVSRRQLPAVREALTRG